MKLGNYNEIIGNLCEVKHENDQIKLVFSFQKEIEIPSNAIPSEKLEGFIGGRIGIFNCDGNYKIHEVRRCQNDIRNSSNKNIIFSTARDDIDTL